MRRLFPLAILLLASCVQFGQRSFPERKTQQVGAFTIEYSAGDEAYADVLADLLRKPKLNRWSVKPTPLGLKDLERRRDYFLGRIAAYLGQAHPPPLTVSAYDRFLGESWAWRVMERPSCYALWRQTEVQARLKAGQPVFGFGSNGERGFVFEQAVNLSKKPGANAGPRGAGPALRWPVTIDEASQVSPEQQLSERVDEIDHLQAELGEAVQRAAVFLVLHEATESGIIETYLRSPDRRWFCDGVANYVAMRLIAAEVGAEEAKRYYDLEAELQVHAPVASRIDLLTWPAAENVSKARGTENLGFAEYAFATKAIADICAKHGDDFLPRLFREISEARRGKMSMATVYAAFEKLTGEKMLSYLPKAPTSVTQSRL